MVFYRILNVGCLFPSHGTKLNVYKQIRHRKEFWVFGSLCEISGLNGVLNPKPFIAAEAGCRTKRVRSRRCAGKCAGHAAIRVSPFLASRRARNAGRAEGLPADHEAGPHHRPSRFPVVSDRRDSFSSPFSSVAGIFRSRAAPKTGSNALGNRISPATSKHLRGLAFIAVLSVGGGEGKLGWGCARGDHSRAEASGVAFLRNG